MHTLIFPSNIWAKKCTLYMATYGTLNFTKDHYYHFGIEIGFLVVVVFRQRTILFFTSLSRML